MDLLRDRDFDPIESIENGNFDISEKVDDLKSPKFKKKMVSISNPQNHVTKQT